MVLNKAELQLALREVGQDPPPTATVIQLRQMYNLYVRPVVQEIIHQADEPAVVYDENLDENRVILEDAVVDVPVVNAIAPVGDVAVPVDVIVPVVDALVPEVPIFPAPVEAGGQANIDLPIVPVVMPVVAMPVVHNVNLDAEIDILEKRIAAMRVELMDLNLQLPVQQLLRRDVLFADVQCAIAQFTGDDMYRVRKWIGDYERLMNSMNASANARLLCARRLLGGSAALFMRSVAANTWFELRDQLIDEFDRQVDRRDVYKQLANRCIQKNEPIRQYVFEMQTLGSQIDIEEEELILFIIDGLRDSSPAVSVLYGIRNMTDFKRRLPEYERFRANILKTAKIASSRQGFTVPNVNRPTTFGHMQSACTQPRRPPGACFKCHATSHIYRDCHMRQIVGLVDEQQLHQDQDNVMKSDGELTKEMSVLQMVSVYFLNEAFGHTSDTKKKCCSLFDTGSPVNFVQKSVLPIGMPYDNLNYSHFKGLGGTKIITYGTVNLKIEFGQVSKLINLFVVPDSILPTNLLLGRDFLKSFGIGLQYIPLASQSGGFKNNINNLNLLKNNKKINFLFRSYYCASDFAKRQLELLPIDSKPESKESQSCSQVPDIFKIVTDDKDMDNIDVGVDFGQENFKKCNELVEKLTSLSNGLVETLFVHKMTIRLSTDTPFHSAPRRLSYHEREKVEKITQDLLSKGIIRPSSSPYASPIVLVRKKNGEIRMCVDYRALNRLTVRDNYPLPLIDDCIEHLEGKKCFSLLDLKSGFHQVIMEEKSVQYTSFVTPHGQFEYVRMPFGLKNGPSVFQRFITNVFDDLIRSRDIVVYMDDILVATTTADAHLVVLSQLFDRLKKYGLEINLKKCHLLQSSIEYLGYLADEKGIRPSGSHCSTIKNYPMPTNLREVQSCLGLFSYFRRFVPLFSRVALPLLNLMKSKTEKPFVFDTDCERAFYTLREALADSPVLAIYSSKRETELHTDASSHGFGAVLLQKQNDGKLHPVSYYSRRTTDAEEKYHSFELETLAIIYSLRRFRVYLEGIPFLIVTDCNSLTQTLSKKSLNPRIARWALELENYQYKITHRMGTSMGHVDALSRNPSVGLVQADDVDVQLQATQYRDPLIVNLRTNLEDHDVDKYELSDGLVYRKMEAGHKSLYVPVEMEQSVIRLIHEKIGHLGVDKCYQQIRFHYWFPSMHEKIQIYIQNCIRCIMHTPPRRINERTLHSIPKEPIPFDTIHIDHFGPLAHTMNKNKHILVVIDAFTKFVKLYAVNTTSTKEVCAALQKYFDYYSRPRRLIADRGTCFTSLDFASFVSERNIQHIKNAVASPQANGQVERVNRVMGRMLGKITNPVNHADWSRLLSRVEFAINNSAHSSTGETPSKLLFGVTQRGPEVDELTEFLDARQNLVCPRDVLGMREKADNNIKKSQKRNEVQYAKRSIPPHQYVEGDFVVIRNVDTTIGTNKKLIPKYRGPYVVHKVLQNDRYVIRDIENCQMTQIPYDGVLEAARLKLWVKARDDIVGICYSDGHEES